MTKILAFLLAVALVVIGILLLPLPSKQVISAVGASPFMSVAMPQPTPTMNITAVQLAPAVIKKIQDLGRLETKSLTIEQPIELQRSDPMFLGLKDSELVQLAVRADVIAGVDLDKLQDSDIQITNDGVSIDIPGSEIFNVVPDEQSLLPLLHTTSLFGNQRDSFVQKAREVALDAIRQTAIEQGICEQANETARVKIKNLIERLGVHVVVVSSKHGNCR